MDNKVETKVEAKKPAKKIVMTKEQIASREQAHAIKVAKFLGGK